MKTIFLAILFLFSSCSTLNIPEPDVSLVSIEPGEISFFETTLHATVRIHNNSSKVLKISGSSHILSINDIDLGKASSDQEIEIAPLGENTQELKIRVSNLSLVSKMDEIINSENFSYRIDSEFFLPSFLGLKSVKTSRSGKY